MTLKGCPGWLGRWILMQDCQALRGAFVLTYIDLRKAGEATSLLWNRSMSACVRFEKLRVFLMRSRNPDLVSVIERRIDEFTLGEVPEERTGLERLAQVI